MKSIYILIITFFTFVFFANASNIHFQINHKLKNETFELSKRVELNLITSFVVDRCQYYLSDFKITHDGGKITVVPNSYILVTADKEPTIKNLGNFDINVIEAIEFGIGVPSSVNNGDPTLWEANHPLAPQDPSMHWGWSSGYRFLAYEGRTGGALTTSFQFHSLGNQNYNTVKYKVNAINDENGNLVIAFDADYVYLLNDLNIMFGLIEHSDSGPAVVALNNLKNSVFTPVSKTSVENDKSNYDFRISPNPSNGKFTIHTIDKISKVNQIKIVDLLGNIVYQANYDNSDLNEIEISQNGIYFVTLYQNENLISSQKLIVK